MFKAAIAVAAALSVSACGSTIYSQIVDPPGKSQAYFVNCLKNNGFLGGEKASIVDIATQLRRGVVPEQRWPDGRSITSSRFTAVEENTQITNFTIEEQAGAVHLFLDCYIAHVSPTDIEGRLLRGHIVTTLLTQYGAASLMAKQRSAKADDAATMIFHIRRASVHLMAVSPAALERLYSLTGPKAETSVSKLVKSDAASTLKNMAGKGPLRHFRNAQRTAAVFDIGTDIARVDNRYVTDTAGTIFDVVSTTAATGGFNPSVVPKLQSLLESAVAGLSLTAQSEWYGSAFVRDAQESLFNNLNDVPTAGILWLAWQTRLNAGCEGLKAITDTRAKPCEPTVIEMADYIKREYPDHPYLDALLERASIDVKKK